MLDLELELLESDVAPAPRFSLAHEHKILSLCEYAEKLKDLATNDSKNPLNSEESRAFDIIPGRMVFCLETSKKEKKI